MAEDQEFTLPPLEERSLVTFALFAYNQEKYIREAVEGAFAQTYEPLEIILSDDCSTDRTFEIIQKMAAIYRGPHRVISRRNTKNLGIAPHVNKVDLEAKGALIIHAAGDDTSLPNRTEALVRTWLSQPTPPSVLVSNAQIIDKNGNIQGHLVDLKYKSCLINDAKNQFNRVLGCSLAVDKRLFSVFDTIDEKIIAEDSVIYKRAELLNGIYYLNEQLVKWRDHSSSITKSGDGNRDQYLRWQLIWAKDTLRRIQQSANDRLKLGMTGTGYPPKYEAAIHLKITSISENPMKAIYIFMTSIIRNRIQKEQLKEILKIILVRLKIINP